MPEPKPSPDDTPLYMASRDQIVVELQRRHGATLVATEDDCPQEDATEPPIYSWSGGFSRVLGLVVRLHDRLRSQTAPAWTETTKIKVSDGDDEAPWRGGA